MTEALTTSQLWENLRAGIQQPISYEECARQHLDLYQELATKKATTASAVALTA
jgi:hypothetical protein